MCICIGALEQVLEGLREELLKDIEANGSEGIALLMEAILEPSK